jgi:hypothetical protein
MSSEPIRSRAFMLFVRFTRARGEAERRAESGPSFGPRRRRFLFDVIDDGERWQYVRRGLHDTGHAGMPCRD